MQDARNHTQPHVHSQTTQRTHPPSTTESGRAGRPHWPLPRACLILRAPKSSTVQGQARPRAVVGVVAVPSLAPSTCDPVPTWVDSASSSLDPAWMHLDALGCSFALQKHCKLASSWHRRIRNQQRVLGPETPNSQLQPQLPVPTALNPQPQPHQSDRSRLHAIPAGLWNL